MEVIKPTKVIKMGRTRLPVYHRQTMLNLIDRDEVLLYLYDQKCEQYCDPELKFDKDGVNRALKELFDERILNLENDPIGVYDVQWFKEFDRISPSRALKRVPEHSELSLIIKKLITVYGWQKFLLELERYSNIKSAEMNNFDFELQVEAWAKANGLIKKLSRMNLVN